MKKIIAIASIYILFSNNGFAQDGMSGYFMQNTLQRSHFNPAFYDDTRVNISIGNLSASLTNTSDNWLSQTTENDEGVTIVDLNAIEREDSETFGYFDVGTIELSFRVDSTLYINAGHRIEGDIFAFISRDMVNLALDGNAPYIGQTLELAPDFRTNIYSSLYLGFAKKLGNIDIGARMSYLSGLQNFSVESSQLNVTTSDEFYQLQFDNDFRFNSSGGIVYNSLDDIESDFEGASFGANSGIAFDLGLVIRLTDNLTVSASAIDLGSITWSDDPQNFSSTGSFEYDGVNIEDFIDDDVEIELTDSLKNLLNIVETNNEYSTSIAARYLLGAEYVLNNKFRFGGVVSLRDIHDTQTYSLGLNASARLTSFWDLGIIYSTRPSNTFNLGLHTSLNLGPIQFLLASDNIFGLDISESTSAHFRTGLAVRI